MHEWVLSSTNSHSSGETQWPIADHCTRAHNRKPRIEFPRQRWGTAAQKLNNRWQCLVSSSVENEGCPLEVREIRWLFPWACRAGRGGVGVTVAPRSRCRINIATGSSPGLPLCLTPLCLSVWVCPLGQQVEALPQGWTRDDGADRHDPAALEVFFFLPHFCEKYCGDAWSCQLSGWDEFIYFSIGLSQIVRVWAST